MIIAVGTMNRAKNEAIQRVAHAHWPAVTLHAVDVPSDIRAQPLSDEETITGALNRARAALQRVTDAQYGVGLEGGVHTIPQGTFLTGWAAIVSRDGKEAVGGSPRILLPAHIARALADGKELGPLMDALHGTHGKTISQENGAFGVLTHDRLTRTDQFVTAIECALAPFVNEQLYRQ